MSVSPVSPLQTGSLPLKPRGFPPIPLPCARGQAGYGLKKPRKKRLASSMEVRQSGSP